MTPAGPSSASLEAAVGSDAARLLVAWGAGGGRAVDGLLSRPEVRVGVDLVAVADVAGSLGRFGDRYLRRVFTQHELSSCRTAAVDGYSCQGLAARFAAKEAALKVLRPSGWRPQWPSIEVHSAADGWCTIRLGGRARLLAEQAGIDELAVSLTHEDALAGAVVVGLCGIPRLDRQDDPPPPTGEKGMD